MDKDNIDHKFMRRAIELAKRGAGRVSPNPMVGAVIVSAQGEVIGEGWHEKYGEAHAEVNAVRSVKDQSLLSSATIYVTLEPCSHWGKTPPCCDLVIDKRFKRLVVGCVDPNPRVSGSGIEKIRQSGISVTVGILEGECIALNRRFFTVQTEHRPYVIFNWAQSKDRYIDITRDPAVTPAVWLTGERCREVVHRWRAEEDAIMVGRRTVEMDNPELTVRSVAGRNPVRVTMDRNLVLDPHQKIFNAEARTVLFTDNHNLTMGESRFMDHNSVEVVGLDYTGGDYLESQILKALYDRKISSVIIEGGTTLTQSFIGQGLWDEAWVFTSSKVISEFSLKDCQDSSCGVAAPELKDSELYSTEEIDGVELSRYKNKNNKYM